MIYTVVNTKGGSGKSTVSSILPIFFKKNEEFKIIEVDNNNRSTLTYSNSIILKNRIQTVKVKEAEDALDTLIFEALQTNNTVHLIIDAGGGDDSLALLNILKNQIGQDKIKYIIPISQGTEEKNIIDTYSKISNKKNIMFCLNSYFDIDDIQSEFFNFFGDKKLKFKGVIDDVENKNYMMIPYSKFFTIAKKYNITLIDLANFSNDFKSPDDASAEFLKICGEANEKYYDLFRKYRISKKANEVLNTIKDNLLS